MRAAAKDLAGPVLAILMLAILAACSQQTGAKTMDVLWPDLGDPYQQTARQWTRSKAIYSGINAEFLATATLLCPPWREAFATRYAQVYSLPPDRAEVFRQDQLAAAAAHTEVVLSLSSPKPDLSRLDFKDPKWRVFLVLKDGGQVQPLEIAPMEPDLWPQAKLEAFFPFWKRWQRFYTLRFPPVPDGPVAMVLSGPAGRVEFNWERTN